MKPDLVAPGNQLISYRAPNNLRSTSAPELNVPLASGETAADALMYQSGTSMSAPIVAGAAALLLQANPNLTPGMVRMILQYTAQPLAGADMFEQGAGQLNLEGALRLVGGFRDDLNYESGVSRASWVMVSGWSMPATSSTIGGNSFPWSQLMTTNHAFLTGSNLVTRFQVVYRPDTWRTAVFQAAWATKP